MKTLTLLLFSLWPILILNAQPQTDPIRTVEDIGPIKSAMQKRYFDLEKSGKGYTEAATLLRDSITLSVVGQEVTASYLVDRDGNVWNLGVMELPFVIYTFSYECRLCARYMDAINTVAREFADEVISFVLLPTPTKPHTTELLEGFNDNVVILFDDQPRKSADFEKDSRLLGLLGNPMHYFITAKRRIVGMAFDGYTTIHPRKGQAEISRKIEREIPTTLKDFVKG
ncbi:hypothetical protein [Neolewinella agarilytica]|uniref:Thioredoxin domain-containing protein n=1 Tax=Neolewinella agarilytica TaxID=478744 RepID=A0A1H9I3N6_9BACT|nr:hypothetical protein [Neolewinella agarilytica]SEQ69204.1 hypothetical protein SAMN05444359_11427 [Neolewinella agarilytica]